MQYYELDKEEKEILAEVERGEWLPVKNLAKEKRRLKQIARNTLNKTRNINLRLSERDLQKLKAKAVREGIPYQTLASSILHKVASGNLYQ
ncbi:hypothetical protein HYZ05_01320 [Candidatus Daviesbacteria bacterium]|nr:hypothetical protein [Candidatus Daviesbacteria bacterium]